MSCVFLSTPTIIKPVLTLSYSEEQIVFTQIEPLPEPNVIIDSNLIDNMANLDLNTDLAVETPEIKKGVPKPPKSSRRSTLGRGGITQNPSSNKIKQRLAEYGAKTGDIQISLSWDNFNDIDLCVEYIGPYSESIWWNNKIGLSGGVLDIDMNATPMSNKAVENIFWQNAKPGLYVVHAYFYHRWDNQSETEVEARIVEQGRETMKRIHMSPSRYFSTIYSFRIPDPTYR